MTNYNLSQVRSTDEVLYFLALFCKSFKKRGIGKQYKCKVKKMSPITVLKVNNNRGSCRLFSSTEDFNKRYYLYGSSNDDNICYSVLINSIKIFYRTQKQSQGRGSSYYAWYESTAVQLERAFPKVANQIWKRVDKSNKTLRSLRDKTEAELDEQIIEEVTFVDLGELVSSLFHLVEKKITNLIQTNILNKGFENLVHESDVRLPSDLVSDIKSNLAKLSKGKKKHVQVDEFINEFCKMINYSKQDLVTDLMFSEHEEDRLFAIHIDKNNPATLSMGILDKEFNVRLCAQLAQQNKLETKINARYF